MRISHAIEIDQPPERVFSWLDDPARASAWMSGVAKTEILHRTANLVGTSFRETVADEHGATDLQGRVTACTPGRLIAFHLEGRFNDVDVEYRLETIRARTRLSMRADVRFKGATKLLSLLMWPLFKSKVLRQFRQDCAALKRLCAGDGVDRRRAPPA